MHTETQRSVVLIVHCVFVSTLVIKCKSHECTSCHSFEGVNYVGSTLLVLLKPAKPLVDCAAGAPRLPLGCLPEVVTLPTLLMAVSHICFQHCLERSEIQPAYIVGCLLARGCVHVGRYVNCLQLSLFTEQLQVAIAVLGSAPYKCFFTIIILLVPISSECASNVFLFLHNQESRGPYLVGGFPGDNVSC